MNIISLALWGDDQKYIIGAIENARLAREIYPGWDVYIHMPMLGNFEVNAALWDIGDAYPVIGFPMMLDGAGGLFERFGPVSDNCYDHVIIRDADSRLNWREKAAVDEWIESGKTFHIMRDHPSHRRPMCGGMWGAKGGAVPDIADKIKTWLGGRPARHDMDQRFLADVVWPEAREDCVIHDSQMFEEHGPLLGFGCITRPISARPFPPHADISPSRFVGDVILADGTPDPSIKDPGVTTQYALPDATNR